MRSTVQVRPPRPNKVDSQTLEKIENAVREKTRVKCDKQHDLSHINRVLSNALRISKNKNVDENLLRAICLIHDLTYTQYDPGIKTYFLEGKYIKNILMEFLNDFDISARDRRLMINACKNHAHVIPFRMFKKRKVDVYTRILWDADNLDFLNEERVDSYFSNKPAPVRRLKKVYKKVIAKASKPYFQFHESVDLLSESYIKIDSPGFLEWNKGAKKDILLIHGYGDNAEMFKSLKDYFPDVHFISVNLPMNYYKDRVFNLKELSRYINKIAEETELKKYTVVGFSLGGLVALEHATNSNNVERLVMLNSYPCLISNTATRKFYKLIKVLIINKPALFLITRINTSKMLRKTFRSSLPLLKDPVYIRNHHVSVTGTLLKNLDYYGIEKYKQLKIPREIILFSGDKILPASRYRKHANKSGIELRILERGEHGVGKEFWEGVSSYLRQIQQTK